MKVLKGTKVTGIDIHFEKLIIRDDCGNSYIMKPTELLKIMNEINFYVEKKRIHEHLTIKELDVIDDHDNRVTVEWDRG